MNITYTNLLITQVKECKISLSGNQSSIMKLEPCRMR